MSAIIAVDKNCLHSTLSLGIFDFSHTCILPGIFNCVGEDDVFAGDVEAFVQGVVIAISGRAGIVIENIMAVFEPIVRSKKFRAHGIDSIWNLEPSEFSTHLPHPLSTIIVYVISDVLKYTSIVSVNIIITLSCPLLNYWKLLLHTSCCDTVKNIAHLFTLPVLNTASEYICDKGHEITHRKSASTEY